MRHYDVVAAEPGEAGGHSSLLLNAAESSSRRPCARLHRQYEICRCDTRLVIGD